MIRLVPFALTLLSVVAAGSARGESSGANAARLMWSAFQCSIYAEMMDDPDEQQRLFIVGYEAGQRFLEALASGAITADEFQSKVPIGVSFLLAGPTTEFVLGRVFESVAEDAFDEVVKEDETGTPRAMSEWVTDDALRAAIAANRYLNSNCEIL